MLIKVFIPDCTSFPNKFNIFLYMVELSISPFIEEFKISFISISSKNSPVYCLDFSIKELTPNVSCCSSKVFSVEISVA